MSDIFRLPSDTGHPELKAMAEALLRRVKDGLVVGLALVEHRGGDADDVFIEYCDAHRASYHQLNSGAAQLAHMLAAAPSKANEATE